MQAINYQNETIKFMQFQQTLRKSYSFQGKGLHTGRTAHMTINPAPVNTGIRFRRTDLGPDAYVDALAENVSNTARSTTRSVTAMLIIFL